MLLAVTYIGVTVSDSSKGLGKPALALSSVSKSFLTDGFTHLFSFDNLHEQRDINLCSFLFIMTSCT